MPSIIVAIFGGELVATGRRSWSCTECWDRILLLCGCGACKQTWRGDEFLSDFCRAGTGISITTNASKSN
jgi:hypothetical protein